MMKKETNRTHRSNDGLDPRRWRQLRAERDDLPSLFDAEQNVPVINRRKVASSSQPVLDAVRDAVCAHR
jgi:hypothetical protein